MMRLSRSDDDLVQTHGCGESQLPGEGRTTSADESFGEKTHRVTESNLRATGGLMTTGEPGGQDRGIQGHLIEGGLPLLFKNRMGSAGVFDFVPVDPGHSAASDTLDFQFEAETGVDRLPG